MALPSGPVVLASKFQALVNLLALKAALAIFGITLKLKAPQLLIK